MAKYQHGNEEKLPDYLNWDNMEDGIMSKFDELESAETNQKQNLIKRWGLLTAAGILLCLGLVCLLSESESDADALTAGKTELKKEVKTEPGNAIEPEQSSDTSYTTEEDRSTSEQSNETLQQIKEQGLSDIKTVSKKTENRLLSVKSNYSDQTSESNFKDQNLNQTEAIEEVINTKNSQQTSSKVGLILPDRERLSLEPIATLSLSPLSETGLNQPTLSQEVNAPISSSKWEIGFAAGMSHRLPGHQGNTLAKTRRAAEKSITGWSGQLRASFNLSHKWQISTGLDYTQVETRLDYYGEKEISLTENRVTRVELNAVTGDTLSIKREDVTVTGIAWERVVHHNKYQYFSVPVLLSRKWGNAGKFTFATGLGLKYHFLGTASGKTLVETDTGIETALFDAKDLNLSHNLSLLGSVSANYKLNGRWSIAMRAEVNKFLSDLDAQSEVRFSPTDFATTLGLNYHF